MHLSTFRVLLDSVSYLSHMSDMMYYSSLSGMIWASMVVRIMTRGFDLWPFCTLIPFDDPWFLFQIVPYFRKYNSPHMNFTLQGLFSAPFGMYVKEINLKWFGQAWWTLRSYQTNSPISWKYWQISYTTEPIAQSYIGKNALDYQVIVNEI